MSEQEETQSESNAVPAEPSEETLTLTTSQLKQRMDRAVRAALKRELGVDSLDSIKADIARKAELEKVEEERRQQSLTAQQRLEEQLANERAAREAAEAQAEQARVDLHLSRLFAKHGVKNADYATWRIMDKLNALGDDEELDEEAFLTGLLAHDHERIALGLEARQAAPAEPQRVAVPATTTTPPGTAPKAPTAGVPLPPKSAYDLSPQEWHRRKAELGIP